jgi:pimeloyl-ACP methyl ester carboxylesterase
MTSQVNFVKANGVELWTEGFGDKQNPALVLIMGSGGQGVLWPVAFCQQLAAQGYFVIRFDHRDTGLSSLIDFTTRPYNLLDMANDVRCILDHYQLRKAHIVGASMGGAIAMIFGAHFPEHTHSLTLMVTTTDLRPAFDALQGLEIKHALPAPAPKVLAAAKIAMNHMPELLEDKIQLFINNAETNSGSIPVDKELCRELALEIFQRSKWPDNVNNHFQAMMRSHDIHAAAPGKITAPTHILHGSEDPIFPVEHGKAIHAAISGSTLYIMPGLGHNLANRQFFQPAIDNILSCTKRAG